MNLQRWVMMSVLTAGLLAVIALSRPAAQTVRFSFDQESEGWGRIPPPTGVEAVVGVTHELPGSAGALEVRYRLEPRRLAGVLRTVAGLVGGGVRLRLRTDSNVMLVIGVVERDGSAYRYVLRPTPGEWVEAEVPFTRFTLSEDGHDENGRLDPDQVGTLVVADARGFLPGAGGEATLWIDEYEVIPAGPPEEPQRYIPLLTTGLPSASGARATVGVSYPRGRFGQGVLADAPGELTVVAVPGLQREQGTIELWISPQFDMTEVRDWTALLAMQTEPFIVGLRGSLLLFYSRGRQIVFVLNADMASLLATPPLPWKAGEWHHLALSWGPRGMRLYLDGRVVGRNDLSNGPAQPGVDLVVGNHAWSIASHRFANTVIDELRVSAVQRPDESIATAAVAAEPLTADEHTVALEHFDGVPIPPLTLAAEPAPFRARPARQAIDLTVQAPAGLPALSRLAYRVYRPDGKAVHEGFQTVGEAVSAAGVLTITLPALDRAGFYRCDLRLEGEGTVLSTGSEWFRLLADRDAQSPLLFGASGCYAEPHDREAFFRFAAAAGVRSLRMPFEWAEIEPEDNRFVWDRYDRIVAWAAANGVELIPTFIWESAQPGWAGRGSVKTGLEEGRYPPENMVAWKDFVYQVVRRYHGTVKWWIPANEPNLARYWYPEPNARDYVALLKATREAARQADPEARMVGCNVAGMDLRFLEQCFKEGALDHCEAVGAHPYICPHSPDEPIAVNVLDPASPVGTFADGLRRAGELIGRYGGHQKLWLDEVGQPYRDDFVAPDWGVPEATAAAYLVRIYLDSLASGVVERALWFSFWGGDYGSFALVRPDGSPTLPLIAYVATAERLAGATFAGEGQRDEGVRSLLFRRGPKEVEALWCPQGQRAILLGEGEQAFDLYGFPLEEANHSHRATLNRTPIWLLRPVAG